MAEVPYGPVMETSTNKPQKRVLGDDITNFDTTTGPPKQKKKNSPPDEFVGGWSADDLSSSEPHSDATEGSVMARQTYGFTLVLQQRHSSEIASSVEFYVHKAPNAVEAVQARKSGKAMTFVPTPEQPLEQMPTGGGVCHVKNASKISPDVVGVNESYVDSTKKARDRQARQLEGKSKGPLKKGETRARPFRLWRSDREEQSASPWYTDCQTAFRDCKRRWPNVDKKHPDFETTRMGKNVVLLLPGKDPRKIPGCSAKWKSLRDNTKWKLEWKKPGA